MTIVSRAEFARLQGYDRSYVTRLAQAGRLVMHAEGRVDVEASIERIKATEDPNRDDVRERHARERAAKAAAAAVRVEDGQDDPETENDDPEPPDAAPVNNGYADARAEKERWAAKHAQLDYEKAAGRLVESATVAAAGRELGTLMRQVFERMPDQLAPELAAELDADRVHALLQSAIDDALRLLSERCRALAERVMGGSQA